MKNQAYIEQYLTEMHAIIDRLSTQHIDDAIELLFDAWKAGQQVFTMGNGGSASTATHLACDLAKATAAEGRPRFRVIGLTDNIPLMSAHINDNGWDDLFVEQLKNLLSPGDVVIGISVHGGSGKDKAGAWSQNLLKAMDYAKAHGAKTIGFSGFDGGAMKDLADVCMVVPFPSTPQVESFHVCLHHLLCFCLKERIAQHGGAVQTTRRAPAAPGPAAAGTSL